MVRLVSKSWAQECGHISLNDLVLFFNQNQVPIYFTIERNYHIFYQLCAAAPAAERAELGLGTWDTFHYLNQGNTGIVHEMDDVQEFEATQKALSVVGVSVSVQW